MKTKPQFKRIISLFLVCVMSIWVLLSLSSCFYGIGGTDKILSKEELIDAVSAECNKDFETVADYLDYWNFPLFSKAKLISLERLYRTKFVEELPEPLEKARAVGNYYLEFFYTGEEKSIEETTDMLVYSFVETSGDRYSIYRTAEEYEEYDTNMSGSFVGIGITVKYNPETNEILVTEVIEDAGAHKAGIMPGDYVIKVNGEDVQSLGYEKAIANIKGEAGTTVDITVLRNENEITFTVTREKIVQKTVSYSIENDIAYIKVTSFKANTAAQFREAVDEAIAANAKGIIYDLRNNLGGYLNTVINMLDYIAPKGTMLASFTNDYMDPVYSKSNHIVVLPTVVICNSSTASAGELFTAAIRDFSNMGFFEASLVGEKTFGKGIMQNTYLFSDNSSITMTVAYYNPPSGINYHDKGIIPDIIEENEDLQLSAAYTEITNLINNK